MRVGRPQAPAVRVSIDVAPSRLAITTTTIFHSALVSVMLACCQYHRRPLGARLRSYCKSLSLSPFDGHHLLTDLCCRRCRMVMS